MITSCYFQFQNASSDVDKMILGNKCDLSESRVVRLKEENWYVCQSENMKYELMGMGIDSSSGNYMIWAQYHSLPCFSFPPFLPPFLPPSLPPLSPSLSLSSLLAG